MLKWLEGLLEIMYGQEACHPDENQDLLFML